MIPLLQDSHYNSFMNKNIPFRAIAIMALIAAWLSSAWDRPMAPAVRQVSQSSEVTAYDLIIAMNTLRVSYGLSALIEDPIINAVAQATAEIMAANQMSWHIGDVSGRLTAAGYGGGYKVWATENFAVGSSYSIDEIMLVWSDDSHMIPAINPAYCNVGAGIAKSSNGMTYYVLQAAYTSGKACGEYKPPGGGTTSTGGSTISQIIVPVKIATPDADGKVYHIVEAGQSFWSIAIAYKITIKDLEIWNNISSKYQLPIGKKLFIPGSNTKGYSTPTPVGMIQVVTPDKDGRVIHTVASYQTLTSISQAYGVKIETILALNGIQADWPLQIGQKLIINRGSATPSPTPRPLTAVEKLTPASDGKYYHEIRSGETLSWIAQLYEVNIYDLMAWNGMNESTIIQPGQKILLQVTPPTTATSTPGPATATQTARPILPTATSTISPTSVASSSTPFTSPTASSAGSLTLWILPASLIVAGILLFMVIFRGRKS